MLYTVSHTCTIKYYHLSYHTKEILPPCLKYCEELSIVEDNCPVIMLLWTKLCIEKSEICLQLSPNTSTYETVHSSYSNLVKMCENVLNQEIMFLNREDKIEQIDVQKCSDMMWSALKCLQHIRYMAIFEFEVS